ncbi:hypothetical protein V3C99_012393 [Haemonchus contortus]
MDTPLSRSRVQERPVERSCIDRSPPMPSSKFDQDVALLMEDQSLPQHLRSVLGILLEDRKFLHSVLCRNRELAEEVSALKAENAKLKAAASGAATPNPLTSQQVTEPSSHVSNVLPVSPVEVERKRSIVLIGVPESYAQLPSERLVSDINVLKKIFDYLGIECSPLTIYRMGRANAAVPRLLKVVLPSSFYARQVLRRAPRLRYFSIPKIFIRPSLTREERSRARTAPRTRLAQRNTSSFKLVENQDKSIGYRSFPELVDVSDVSVDTGAPVANQVGPSNL